MVSGYGLFRRMTGVGENIKNEFGLNDTVVERPEIIIEGSYDNITWTPFEFMYKPGDLREAPKFVAPYQPRLDWQMWFACKC